MYKLIGIIFVFASSVAVFYKENIKAVNTYKFLTQTAEVASYIKLGCSNGKTYSRIFSDTDFSKYRFYRDFEYERLNYSTYMVDEQRLDSVNNFFINLGQRNKYAELEYINQNINFFNIQAEKFKSFYERNKQTSMLTGLSVARIITIVLI